MAEKSFVWSNFADFQDLKILLYNQKKDIQTAIDTDPEHGKIYFIEKPEMDKEAYRKELTIKKYEILQKTCHAVMIIGWENIIESNEQLQESTADM